MRELEQALQRLEADGLIVCSAEAGMRTTKRWQAAMRRAAARLVILGETQGDLRVPVTMALLELYRGTISDEELVELVNAAASVEAAQEEALTSRYSSPP